MGLWSGWGEGVQAQCNGFVVRQHQACGLKIIAPIEAFTDGLKLVPKPDLNLVKLRLI